MRALKKPFSFKGRFDRGDFVLALIMSILSLYIFAFTFVFSLEGIRKFFQINVEGVFLFRWIVFLPSIILLLAAGKKRLNDLELSGWLQLLYPLTFFIILFKRGTDKDNEHGPSLHIDKKSTDYKDNVKLEDIPIACPICKNPNSQKLLVCEWCGNRIV